MKNLGLEALDKSLEQAKAEVKKLNDMRNNGILPDLQKNWYYNGVSDLMVGQYTAELAIDPASYKAQRQAIKAHVERIEIEIHYATELGTFPNHLAALNARKLELEAESVKLKELNKLIKANDKTTQDDLAKVQKRQESVRQNFSQLEEINSSIINIHLGRDEALNQTYGLDPASVKINIGRLNTLLKTPFLLSSIAIAKASILPVLPAILGVDSKASHIINSLQSEVITQVLPTVIGEINALSLDEFRGLMNSNYSDPAFIKATIHATTKLNRTLSMDTIDALKPLLVEMLGKDSMVTQIINACSDKLMGEDLNKLLVVLDRLSLEDYAALLGSNYRDDAFVNGKHLSEVMSAVSKLGGYLAENSISELRPVLDAVLQGSPYVQNIVAVCEDKVLQKNIPALFDALGALSAKDFDALLGNDYPSETAFLNGKHLNEVMVAVSKLNGFFEKHSIEDMKPLLKAVLGEGYVMNIVEACTDKATNRTIPEVMNSLKTITPAEFDLLLSPKFDKDSLKAIIAILPKLKPILEKDNFENLKPVLMQVFGNESTVGKLLEPLSGEVAELIFTKLQFGLGELKGKDLEVISKYLMERQGLSKAALILALKGIDAQKEGGKDFDWADSDLANTELFVELSGATSDVGETKSELQEKLDAQNLQAAMQAAAPVLQAVAEIMQNKGVQQYVQAVTPIIFPYYIYPDVRELNKDPKIQDFMKIYNTNSRDVDLLNYIEDNNLTINLETARRLLRYDVEEALEMKMDAIAKSDSPWEMIKRVKEDSRFKNTPDRQIKNMLYERQMKSFVHNISPVLVGVTGAFLVDVLKPEYKKDVLKLFSGAPDTDMTKALLGVSAALKSEALNKDFRVVAGAIHEHKQLFVNMLQDVIKENPRLNAMGFTEKNVSNLVSSLSNKDMMDRLGDFMQMAADKQYGKLVFKSIKEIGFTQEVRKLTASVLRDFLVPGFIKSLFAGTSINNTIKECADKDLGATCDKTNRTWLKGFLIKGHNFSDQTITESMRGMKINDFNFSNSKFIGEGLKLSGAVITNCDFSNISVSSKGVLDLSGAKIDENSLISLLGAMQKGAKVNISDIEISGPVSVKNAEQINKVLDSLEAADKDVIKTLVESSVVKSTENPRHSQKIEVARESVSPERSV